MAQLRRQPQHLRTLHLAAIRHCLGQRVELPPQAQPRHLERRLRPVEAARMDGCVHRFPVPPHPPGYCIARMPEQPKETHLPRLPLTHPQSLSRFNHGAEYRPDHTAVGYEPVFPPKPLQGQAHSHPASGLFSPLKGGG